MTNILLVATGGFLGAMSRFAISQKLSKNQVFPYGTLTVNLIGSFFLGLLTGIHPQPFLILLLGSGFMGAFTTFSTLSLESITMLQEKRVKALILYLSITYGGGILLAYIGHIFGILFS